MILNKKQLSVFLSGFLLLGSSVLCSCGDPNYQQEQDPSKIKVYPAKENINES